MRKAICSSMFNKEDFVDMLNNNGVEAELTDDGFIFSERVFELNPGFIPYWIYMNLKWLRSCEQV